MVMVIDRGGEPLFSAPILLFRYATRFIGPQLLSAVQMPRSSRKRSTGTEEPSARMRHKPTPVHWKPHFSSTRRDAGLVTRTEDCSALCSVLVNAGAISARTASVGRPF